MLTLTPRSPCVVTAGPNMAAKAKEEEEWRKPIPIDMKFGVGLKTRPPRNRPMAPSLWGWIIFLFYIATFAFYAYCRIAHTLDSHDPAFAYQVCLLLRQSCWESTLFYVSLAMPIAACNTILFPVGTLSASVCRLL